MIFRLTQKTAKKIHVTPERHLPLDENPFADWHAHLFRVAGAQHIILTSTTTLYSAVICGRGLTSGEAFARAAVSRITEVLADSGYERVVEQFVAPAAGTILFARTGDRRVLGSINDLVRLAEYHLAGGRVAPHDVSFLLNRVPMGLLKMASPAEALAALIKERI